MKEAVKKYNIGYNIGKSKYVVNFHNGNKFHADNSPFYDIRIFTNKVKMKKFIKELKEEGYINI
jgi:hypothetical protein